MTELERLGVAISDAGITWSAEMRSAWDAAKDKEQAQTDATTVLVAIEEALASGYTAAQVLDENSPIRDTIRDCLRTSTPKAQPAPAAQPQQCQTEDDCTHMPWCRIRGACQKAQPQQERDPPMMETLVNTYDAVTQERDCDAAFDAWYSMQRHQLSNEQVCRLIWTRGWQAAIAQRKPLSDARLVDIYYCVEGGESALETWLEQARAIEAAHGIK